MSCGSPVRFFNTSRPCMQHVFMSHLLHQGAAQTSSRRPKSRLVKLEPKVQGKVAMVASLSCQKDVYPMMTKIAPCALPSSTTSANSKVLLGNAVLEDIISVTRRGAFAISPTICVHTQTDSRTMGCKMFHMIHLLFWLNYLLEGAHFPGLRFRRDFG